MGGRTASVDRALSGQEATLPAFNSTAESCRWIDTQNDKVTDQQQPKNLRQSHQLRGSDGQLLTTMLGANSAPSA